jgi:hypothetical protein
MTRLFAVPLAVAAFSASIHPLSADQRTALNGRFWRPSCPVTLSQLRVLSVDYWGFDQRVHAGELVVNRSAAAPLARVFKQLYVLRFPIRHLSFAAAYGPTQPADGDISGAFECRKAIPSPCGGRNTNWSNHAYGLAVDLNPIENPYVGCGATRTRESRPYLNRKRLRPGMITPAVVNAFRAIGWGWGGSWAGNTKDYMHFSWNGH